MKDGQFDPQKHVNYCHLVGEVQQISHVEGTGVSPHSIIILKVQTEYRGAKHPPMTIQVVAWDHFMQLLKDAEVGKGTLLNIEGRLTVRFKKNRMYFGVTANRIGVVREVGGEVFIETLQEGKDGSQ